MNSIAFIAVLFFVVVALFATRRKGNRGSGRVYRGPTHGAFRNYVAEKENRRSHRFGNSSDSHKPEGGSGDFDPVRYREETTSPEMDKADAPSTLDAMLSKDSHGIFGEAATSAIVARVSHEDGRYHGLFQNVYIPTHAGYTEIDTVLLHETGIYVFETKNVSGDVYGDLEQERWNLHLNERTQHTLYNPLRQNQGHIGALLRQLRLSYSRSHIYSFVVFSDRCVLRRVPASGNRFQVVHLCELKQALSNVFKHSANIHKKRQIDEWKCALSACVNVSEQVKKQHQSQVQKMHGN